MAKKPAPPTDPDPVASPTTNAVEQETWQPPTGGIVTDDRTYYIRVGDVRHVHVADAPDGRWVYRPD